MKPCVDVKVINFSMESLYSVENHSSEGLDPSAFCFMLFSSIFRYIAFQLTESLLKLHEDVSNPDIYLIILSMIHVAAFVLSMAVSIFYACDSSLSTANSNSVIKLTKNP